VLLMWCVIALPAARVEEQRDLKKEMEANQAQADLTRYHGMLAAYQRGDEANSIDALLFLPDERVDRLLALINSSKDPFAPWDQRRRGLAVMLHTDLALRLSALAYTAAAERQLDIATNLLTTFARTETDATRAFLDQWYYTLSRYLRSRDSPYAAERLLSKGRASFADSAAILYESGVLAEAMATDYALAGATVHFSRRGGVRFDLDAVLHDRLGHLRDAERWLRQAAALDPDNDLLRAHLGRVLALLKQDAEAVRVLDGVRDRTSDDATAYVAGVFLGGLRERQAGLTEAAEAYRRAIERFPLGHAAYIGLSEVLQRSGKGDESRDVLHTLLAETTGPTREPLWWYQFDPPGIAEGRLAALRAKVRQ
jgi:tetratricopeptide (TPR) repeat protein